MKIHGICLIKNEADIVDYSLKQAMRWCDFIYVYDNGSSDGTMERVQRLAGENARIIPFGVTEKPFNDNLRSDVFNHFKHRASKGDWWCRLDADEIYADDVPHFLSRVPSQFHVVWSVFLQFYLTDRDLARLEPFAEKPAFEIHEENLPRYYRADYAEPRFFRHRSRLQWRDGSWPDHVGLIAPSYLRHKHYQYRSPAQIEARLRTRREAAAHGWQNFPHIAEKDWRGKIVRAEELHFDIGDGNYLIEKEAVPRNLERGWRRAVKHIMHGLGIWP